MPFKSPSDLINQSQIGFREVAGLSSFNYQNPTLNSLPTVQNSISALDPSPSRFRCKHCEEKLLRESHSLICIYCGQCQANDLPPEPIFFKSTTGYRLLLQSLNLNASEMIEPLVDEKRSNKAGTPAEGVKPLSEFLDVQIKWPDKLEIPETSYVNKMLDHSSSLHFSRVFSFEQVQSGSDASEDDQVDGFKDEDNLSLFQKSDDVPETAAMSSDLSGDRDAEIQPSNSSTQNEDYPKSTADLNRDSSSGNEEEILSKNEDSKDIAADLRRDSSSGDDTEIQSMNKDSKTADISSNLSDDDSSRHEATVNSRAHSSEDLEATANNLKKDSFSSGDDAEVHSQAQKDEDSKVIPSDLKKDSSSSSGDESVNSKSVSVSFDLSPNVETEPTVDSKKDSSSSGDDKEIRQNEDSKTSTKSSNSSDDGHDAEIKFVNKDSKTTGDDSSSGDENSRIQNQDSAIPSNLSDDGSSSHEINQNEDSKPMESDLKRDSHSSSENDTDIEPKTVSVPFDLGVDNVQTPPPVDLSEQNGDSKADSSSEDDSKIPLKTDAISSNSSDEGHDTEIQLKNEDLKSVTKSSSSSDEGHDAEIQTVNKDSSSGDEKSNLMPSNLSNDGSSGHDEEVHPRAQNDENSKLHSDRDSSSGDDTQVQSITTSIGQNDDSKTGDRSSSSSDDKHEVAVKNEDFEPTVDLKRDSSSGDDKEIQSLSFNKQNDDSKTGDRSSSSSDDRHEVVVKNDDFEATVDLKRDSSSSGDEDAKTATVSSNLSHHGSFEVDSKTQDEDDKTTAANKDSSSSEDETENQSLVSRKHEDDDDDESKTDTIVSILKDPGSYEAQNEGGSNSSSGDESVKSKAVSVSFDLTPDVETQPNNDSKPTASDSSSGDENSSIQNKDSTISNDGYDADIHQNSSSSSSSSGDENPRTSQATAQVYSDAEIESMTSSRWNQDSRSKASSTVYQDFSADGASSGDDADFHSGISRWNSTAISSDFRTDDSSSGDDNNSRFQNQLNFNRVGSLSDLNPNPSTSDDKIQDDSVHKD